MSFTIGELVNTFVILFCMADVFHSLTRTKLESLTSLAGQEDIFRMTTVVSCLVVTTQPALSTTVHFIKSDIQTALHIIQRPTEPVWWAVIAHLLTYHISFWATKVVITDCATIICEESPNTISILNYIPIIIDQFEAFWPSWFFCSRRFRQFFCSRWLWNVYNWVTGL